MKIHCMFKYRKFSWTLSIGVTGPQSDALLIGKFLEEGEANLKRELLASDKFDIDFDINTIDRSEIQVRFSLDKPFTTKQSKAWANTNYPE